MHFASLPVNSSHYWTVEKYTSQCTIKVFVNKCGSITHRMLYCLLPTYTKYNSALNPVIHITTFCSSWNQLPSSIVPLPAFFFNCINFIFPSVSLCLNILREGWVSCEITLTDSVTSSCSAPSLKGRVAELLP